MNKIIQNFEDFFKNILKKIPPNIIPKTNGCGSCYLVYTHWGFNSAINIGI
jgi:hypothetical protein